MASLYSEIMPGALIRESVQCGMDLDQDMAILKALVEYVERLAIQEGQKKGLAACMGQRSDGFAAFPNLFVGAQKARAQARTNALGEAIERYVWASWWDCRALGSSFRDCDASILDVHGLAILDAICAITPVRRRLLVRPRLASDRYDVAIFFLILENGGVTSGGACSSAGSRASGILRALGELARHTECARRILNGGEPKTFYERRLHYMATSGCAERLADRLCNSGTQEIILPHLKIDELIPHSFDSLVEVHRCTFENQPEFIGGELERLCL
ncbi:MAG: hypothetical protein AB7G93_10390 [Bdellovibrionales bacterium]